MEVEGGVDWVAWAALALLVLCFGSSFLWFALVLSQYDGWVAGALRLILSALFLIGVAQISGAGLPQNWNEWKWSALYGVTGFAVPFYLVAHAQTIVPSNAVGIFFAATPILLLFLSRAIFSVRITARKWIGCGIGSVGLVLMAGPGTLSQIDPSAGLWPSIMLLIAAVALAVSAVLIRLAPPMSPIRSATGATCVAGALSIPVLLASLPIETPEPKALTGIVIGAVFTTGCGQLLRVFLVRRKGPVFLTPVGYLTAIVGVLLGVVVLSEQLTFETILAGTVILAGVLLAQDGTGSMKKA